MAETSPGRPPVACSRWPLARRRDVDAHVCHFASGSRRARQIRRSPAPPSARRTPTAGASPPSPPVARSFWSPPPLISPRAKNSTAAPRRRQLGSRRPRDPPSSANSSRSSSRRCAASLGPSLSAIRVWVPLAAVAGDPRSARLLVHPSMGEFLERQVRFRSKVHVNKTAFHRQADVPAPNRPSSPTPHDPTFCPLRREPSAAYHHRRTRHALLILSLGRADGGKPPLRATSPPNGQCLVHRRRRRILVRSPRSRRSHRRHPFLQLIPALTLGDRPAPSPRAPPTPTRIVLGDSPASACARPARARLASIRGRGKRVLGVLNKVARPALTAARPASSLAYITGELWRAGPLAVRPVSRPGPALKQTAAGDDVNWRTCDGALRAVGSFQPGARPPAQGATPPAGPAIVVLRCVAPRRSRFSGTRRRRRRRRPPAPLGRACAPVLLRVFAPPNQACPSRAPVASLRDLRRLYRRAAARFLDLVRPLRLPVCGHTRRTIADRDLPDRAPVPRWFESAIEERPAPRRR